MSTKVTSKGQVTIPKSVRDALGLKRGTKVDFNLEGKRAFLEPISKGGVEALAGSLRAYAKARGKAAEKAMLKQVRERVAEHGAKEARRPRLEGKVVHRHKRDSEVPARR